MEKRKPFGDLTNLSGAFFSSSTSVKPKSESPAQPEPRGKKKQGPNLKVSDEKKEDFTLILTKPRNPDQIEKIDQEQPQESSSLEMTEVSPVKGRLRTRMCKCRNSQIPQICCLLVCG